MKMNQPQDLGLDISKSLEDLCRKSDKCAAELQGYLAKQIWTPSDRAVLLDTLSTLILEATCAEVVSNCFRSLLPDLLSRCKSQVECEGQLIWKKHQKFSVVLSQLLKFKSCCQKFAVDYLHAYPPFYKKENPESENEPVPKKRKKKNKAEINQKEIIKAVYQYTQVLTKEVQTIWNWTDFLDLLKDKDQDIRWLTVKVIGLLSGLSFGGVQKLQAKCFSSEEILLLTLRWDSSEERLVEKLDLLRNNTGGCEEITAEQTHTMKKILETDLNTNVVLVAGVLLSKASLTTEQRPSDGFEKLVRTASTQSNLSSIGLAVGDGEAVLLEGPIGCGKTSLVQHLAHMTGRSTAPHLLTVQLGDQTDSRTLLGTYRCTDIAGEFVWQAGSLTQAVMNGHWLLLEDLDYAPVDVLSVLVPLLQSRTLSIPGHGDNIKAHPGFHLFATQRLLSSGSGWYKQHGGNLGILDKMWTKVTVAPMSRIELQQVIVTKYPQLSTVVYRLLDIYLLLSAGRHELSSEDIMDTSDTDAGTFLARDGRLISTRDLMKWCSRIAKDFNVSDVATANMVFLEALDCFAFSMDKDDKCLALALAIGAKLNITSAQVEYYCQKYKPNIDITATHFNIGRISLPRKVKEVSQLAKATSSSFAFTRQAITLLERVAVAVNNNEPVLLVGETGTGKTSIVQYLAEKMGHTLRVINMNQQSDSTDLLGGFKPVDLKFVMAPFREEFEDVFCKTFSRKQNVKFLSHIQNCFSKKKWTELLSMIEHTQKSAIEKFEEGTIMRKQWKSIKHKLLKMKVQVKQTHTSLAFSFMEGSLVKGLKNGDWVLLDEINLAAAETLECLSGLLESRAGSIVLMDRGDTGPIKRHPNFRLFACMNPATDVGKKDLPPGIRNRFTEFYVGELEDLSDLKVLAGEYLKGLSLTAAHVEGIVKFYLNIKKQAGKKLTDGTGHHPHYSLRTFCRALRQAARNSFGSIPRSLYEGFCLSFLTELDRSSYPVVESMVRESITNRANIRSLLKQVVPQPAGGKHLLIEGYWVPVGKEVPKAATNYVLTPSVRANLRDLARVVSAGGHPVLIQGETSVGKTSLVTWLAASSGNVCVRINNHEHTDLQEYVGCYTADEAGKLVFKEGVLVEAMRRGYWIILDELNLAPTDVLEALNRLLDDNRELFIGETQEVVKAHPRFMLFATQNPPGHYGGRKVLSRAFRNRFVELHFDEIPSSELETILHERCQIPVSYCKRMVKVLLELQTRRRSSGVFAGKQGFITLRDLFRWAERYHQASHNFKEKFLDWDQQLADNGYMLLAGRVRQEQECLVIQEVLEKHLRRKVDPNLLFALPDKTSLTSAPLLAGTLPDGYQHVVWTYNFRRMAVLVGQALKFGEPVLLVGETGCGKTTICQLFAKLYEQQLYSVNCHLHTETADFLGGLRPVRKHESEDSDPETAHLFEWVDGPLVTSMKEGAIFLMDEISLADDSVLERLNSVLEPERTLFLAEKAGGMGGQGQEKDIPKIIADEKFKFLATMNPGGDYGKKELSPALRNRMTEIWCPLSLDRTDLVTIIEHNLKAGILLGKHGTGSSGIGSAIMDFVEWFQNSDYGRRTVISIRDLLSWVHFINQTSRQSENVMTVDDLENAAVHQLLDPAIAYIHGACLVFLDALGTGHRSSPAQPTVAKEVCLQYLHKQLETLTGQVFNRKTLALEATSAINSGHRFMIPPFSISLGDAVTGQQDQYALNAPTTCKNGQRVLRALQLTRPILLEGSPGVGKTSLVAALAKASGNHLVRINLSEQTDVSDLFGADLPVEGGQGGKFSWRDGPLLSALKAGHWVVLDELNLASQSVLEGLNACLDHRGQVYIPELGKTFQVQHGKTRFFACQNPLHQGGGRKGLAKSFLNRFTQVYVEPLTKEDLLFITKIIFPQLTPELLGNIINFNMKLHEEIVEHCEWGNRGGPWEFNLRDIFRLCELLIHNQVPGHWDAGEYVNLIYSARMRTRMDKERVLFTFKEVFRADSLPYIGNPEVHISSSMLQIGHSFLSYPAEVSCRQQPPCHLKLLHHSLQGLELVAKCVQMGWMSILVGPASSGKTSLIQLLASLAKRTLHVLHMNSEMDTTELLGGFEQADMARHLDEVQQDAGEVLHDVTSWLMTQETSYPDTTTLLTRLMATWIKIHTVKPLGDGVGAEMELMRRKTEMLQELLHQLHSAAAHVNKTSLDERRQRVEEKLSSLRKRVFEDGMVQQAGSFEWVDSLLVRALQHGHWLLIDNVNFCSPSVLDRLNGLLEPNGVLSINERGVTDGKIPTIKPHPDFRLILAMDPKYGEISRAMRNRGVEIYLLGEDEGGGYDEHDVREMLEGLGLAGNSPYRLLSNIHEGMSSTLPGLTILDLLHTASLTQQQMDRGLDLLTSITRSVTSVYIRTQHNMQLRQKCQEILKEKLSESDMRSEMLEVDWRLSQFMIPSPTVYDWITDPTMASVIHCCRHLQQVIQQVSQGHGDETCHKILPSLTLILERTSPAMANLTASWVKQKVLTRWTPDTGTRNDLAAIALQHLDKVIKSSVRVLGHHSLVSKAQKVIADLSLSQSESEMLQLCALDLRWNPAVMRRLRHTYPEQCAIVSCISNQLQFLVEIAKGQEVYFDGLSADVKISKKTQLSLLQLSCLYHKGGIDVNSLPNGVVIHIYPFLLQLIGQLSEQWAFYSHVTDEQLSQLLEGIWWLEHFVEFCRECAKQQHWQTLLCQLSLHWNWLVNKTLPSLLPPHKQSRELQTMIGYLQGVLGADHAASRLHLKLWHSQGHPAPFVNQQTANLTLTFQLLARQGQLKVTDTLDADKIRFTLYQRQDFVALLLSCLELLNGTQLDHCDEEHLINLESKLTGMLTSYNVIKESTSEGESSVDQPVDKSKVNLWPLYNLCSLLTHLHLLPSLLQNQSKVTKECQKFVDYVSSSVMTDVLHCLAIRSAVCNNETQVTGGVKWSLLLHNLLTSLSNTTATHNTDNWLLWQPQENDDQKLSIQMQQPNVTFSLYTALFSHMTFTLINESEGQSQHSRDSWLPGKIALGSVKEKVNQLQQLSQMMWKHAEIFSSVWDARSNNARLLLEVVSKVLLSLGAILHDEEIAKLHYLVGKLHSSSTIDDSELCQILKNLYQLLSSVKDCLEVLVPSYTDIVEFLIKALQEFVTSHSRLMERRGAGWLMEVFHAGQVWSVLGTLQFHLLQPQGPVDPAYKQTVKLKYAKKQLEQVEIELKVRNEHSVLQTGQPLDLQASDLHPQLHRLLTWQHQLVQQIQAIEKNQALRPQPSQFPILLKEVRQFMTTIGRAKSLMKLFRNFAVVTGAESSEGAKPEAVLREGAALSATLREFANKIKDNYPLYQDLLIPFITGLDMVRHGLEDMCLSIDATLKRKALMPTYLHCQDKESTLLEHVMQTVCRFPTLTTEQPDLLSLVQTLLSDRCLGLVLWLQQQATKSTDGEMKHVTPKLMPSLLQMCLQYASLHCRVRGHLEPATLTCLFHVFDTYLSSWQKMEAERKDKQDREESLYHFRVREHCDNLTEEERDHRDLKHTFPSYLKDFEDISVGFVMDNKPSDNAAVVKEDGEVQVSISDQLMSQLCQHHLLLFTTLTSCQWLRRPAVETPDLTREMLQPLLLAYQLSAAISHQVHQLISSTVDEQLIGCHLIASQVLQNQVSLQDADMSLLPNQERSYDIYRDGNVTEVVRCLSVLVEFETRVQELLAEWPDHPTLKTLVMVMNRIRSFPVTDPLIKFTTGLELLLQKAQEWENYAAKHVSLSQHTENVSRLIIEWRKIELKCWSGCLDMAEWKAEQKAEYWWFHLYQLIHSFIRPQEGSTVAESDSNEKELLKALQQFLEQANIGDFHKRLDLLYSFHCQLVHMDRSPQQELLMHILWNIHQYYSQFADIISRHKKKLRDPTEKDLKGFVKIARWNDINFWSLKSTVEKTHETLHKFIKQYSHGLKQAVRQLLTDGLQDYSQVASGPSRTTVTASVFIQNEKPKVECVPQVVTDHLPSDSIQLRLPVLVPKAHKHVTGIITDFGFFKLANHLDTLTGDIIEAVHELKEEVAVGDKEKQKSAAKLKQQRKRKALADLFKQLQYMGLSYRKGLMVLQDGDTDKVFHLPALDMAAALQYHVTNSNDKMTVESWEGCSHYLYRSVARRALFLTVAVQPAPDLGPSNIAKCKGFIQSLMELSLQQRLTLTNNLHAYLQLRKNLTAVQKLCAESLPTQDATEKIMNELKNVVDQSILGLTQTCMLLQCCPAEDSSCQSPLPSSHMSKLANSTASSPLVEQMKMVIKEALVKLKNLKKEVDTLITSNLQVKTWKHVETIKQGFEEMRSINESLDGVLPYVASPGCEMHNSFSSTTFLVKRYISKSLADFQTFITTECQISAPNFSFDGAFSEKLDSVIKEILLVVQKLVKIQKEQADKNEGQADKDSDTEQGHITQLLTESLQGQIEILSMSKINELLSKLIVHIQTSGGWAKSSVMLNSVKPLLNYYLSLTQCFMTASIAGHRATVKLLSTLLAIFTELAQKGFCPPADYSDEKDREGTAEFMDNPDGGLGEGEGVKDVSDQIESEDQLEDARQAGKQAQEEDPSQQQDLAQEDNAIEMSDDFQGKMHDLEKQEGDEEEEEEEEGQNEEELERQMGDLGEEEANKLDEQMWGSDDETDELKENEMEEQGPGAGQQEEPSIVAKDDNDENDPGNKNLNKQQQQQPKDEEQDEENIHEQIDEREYDENETDPHYGNDQKQQDAEQMDLPDDLNLDEEGNDEGDQEKNNAAEENPYDLDKIEEKEIREVEEENMENDQQDKAQEEDVHEEGQKEKEKEEEGKDDEWRENGKDDEMDTGIPQDEQGLQPQQAERDSEQGEEEEQKQEEPENAMAADIAMTTQHDSTDVQHAEGARDTAGQDNQNESEGVGLSQNDDESGHKGDSLSQVSMGTCGEQKQRFKQRPGNSDINRSLATEQNNVQQRLKMVDSNNQDRPQEAQQKSEVYEHIKDGESAYDAQTMDVATDEQQQQQQPVPNLQEEDEAESVEGDVDMTPDDSQPPQEAIDTEKLQSSKLKNSKNEEGKCKEEWDAEGQVKVEGNKIDTMTVARGPKSTVHTSTEFLQCSLQSGELDTEQLRQKMEEELQMWSNGQLFSENEERLAVEAWQQYEALTGTLSRELCEQLRLVLEPTQASKLRGDYRTGKRLNMRKVIPYIASQFRKDKIWMRRTKPSKRRYQVVLAIDDSSSMADNHSKQLAFESLAVIVNALTFLEVGELAVCCFGENIKLLHPFHEQFSSHAGANILQHMTFKQKKTNIAKLLEYMTAMLVRSRARQQGVISHEETSQLLLIMSDGRGLFLEGMEVVKQAVLKARGANVFLVFVIIDNPENKDSILDIKVPVFQPDGQLAGIYSYMESFPFPFYIILRDINNLPNILSDALRQWFELVTTTSR